MCVCVCVCVPKYNLVTLILLVYVFLCLIIFIARLIGGLFPVQDYFTLSTFSNCLGFLW